jgi:uncharacterized protein YggE
MFRSRYRAPVCAAALVLLIAIAPRAGGAAEEPPSITVTGSAAISARPDLAEVTAGVVTQSATAAQALAENSAAMTRVLGAVAGLGIPERDVQTSSVTVSPQRAPPRAGSPQPGAVVGYEVSNQVRVRVRDFSVLGRLLDTVVGQGANALGGIAFAIADPTALLQQARARAMADAEQKARVYATAAGVKLGRVRFIRDATAGPPRPMAARVMMAAPVPVAPGEQEVEASVSVTYAIE